MHFGTIFSYTHVLQHHFGFHHSTSWINFFIFYFVEDYELNQDLELSFDSFKLTFQHMLNLFANGPSRMVFEHL